MTTVAGLLAARADDDHPAVLDATGSWTWRQVVAAGSSRGALAQSLRQPGPFHVGVLLPNVPEYLFWLGAAALTGATVVGLNPTRRGEALAADVRATDCQLIVTDDDGAALLAGLDLGVDPARLLVVGTEAYDRAVAAFDPDGAGPQAPGPKAPGPKAPGPKATAARAVLAAAAGVTEDQLFLLLFTSGTTGRPKAVRCTQGRLAGIAEVAAPGYGYHRDSVCYCPMPLFHGNALMALWGPALYVGATVALRPRFSASAFLDDVRRYEATMFSYVGKAVAYVLATPERPDDADNTLVSAFGTEASARDRRRFADRFDCVLVEGYGQSEGGATINPAAGMPAGSLGRAAPGVDLAVVDPATGNECPPATFDGDGRPTNAALATGELVNRSGPGKFEGYYGAPDAEADRTRNGWYWTGDLAYRDADGFFYYAGRGGDWLRVDSENFAAGPVEAVLSRHPDLVVVAVYPVPDTATAAGDQVMAAVELRPGATFDPAGFADWLAAQPDLGTKWPPRYVRVTDAIPQTANGKITKAELRANRWETDDPVWWRPQRATSDRNGAYRPLTAEDRSRLAAELANRRR